MALLSRAAAIQAAAADWARWELWLAVSWGDTTSLMEVARTHTDTLRTHRLADLIKARLHQLRTNRKVRIHRLSRRAIRQPLDTVAKAEATISHQVSNSSTTSKDSLEPQRVVMALRAERITPKASRAMDSSHSTAHTLQAISLLLTTNTASSKGATINMYHHLQVDLNTVNKAAVTEPRAMISTVDMADSSNISHSTSSSMEDSNRFHHRQQEARRMTSPVNINHTVRAATEANKVDMGSNKAATTVNTNPRHLILAGGRFD